MSDAVVIRKYFIEFEDSWIYEVLRYHNTPNIESLDYKSLDRLIRTFFFFRIPEFLNPHANP